MTTKGRGFRLRSGDCVILVGPDSAGFGVVFEARALFLRTKGLEAVIETSKRLVRELTGQKCQEIRVRRLDLFADAGGVSFGAEDTGSFLSRSRRAAEFHVPEKNYLKKKAGEIITTGFTFSPGNPIMARLYDKLEELNKVQGADSEKTKTELKTYREAGLTEESVWRLEVQFRSKVLKELRVHALEDLNEQLPRLWAYAFGGERPWLRLIVQDSATRRERCETDPRWEVFRSHPFGKHDEPVKREPGLRGGVSASQALGAIFSILSGHGELDTPPEGKTVAELIDHDLAALGKVLKLTLRKTPEEYRALRAASGARLSHLLDAAKKEAS